jgi:hypothetical protein
MDPLACLLRTEDAINDNDRDEARNAIEDYATWRRKGGFEPQGVSGKHRYGDPISRPGDAFHAVMITLYGLTFGTDAFDEVDGYRLTV